MSKIEKLAVGYLAGSAAYLLIAIWFVSWPSMVFGQLVFTAWYFYNNKNLDF